MADTATYIYCLVESPRKPSATKVPRGLPAATVPEFIDIGRKLWAVSAEVPLSEYGAGQLDERLKDFNWVAGIAIAHEAVVERFASAKGTAVVPMKLFTMYSSRDRASDDLASRRREIDRVLKRIRGCREWGVRVTRAVATATQPKIDATSSGTAFLSAKKRVRDEARSRLQYASDAAEDTFVILAKLAREAHRREAPADATTPPLVDAAFLVSDARQARFKTAVKRAAKTCRDAGAALVLTGPWPAYNFVQTAERA